MPNRASALTHQADPEQEASPAISMRGRIVRTAIALADRDGLGSVSIRKVAGELGVRPMSLYTYVASKDDLLALMGEEVVAEAIVPPPLPAGWRASLTAIALRSHQTFRRHPWLPSIAGHRPHLGHNALQHAEQLLSALAELHLQPAQAWRILYAVNDLTLGHALRIAHAGGDGADGYPGFEEREFPRLAAALAQPAPTRDELTFQVALDLLLDGIQLRHAPLRR